MCSSNALIASGLGSIAFELAFATSKTERTPGKFMRGACGELELNYQALPRCSGAVDSLVFVLDAELARVGSSEDEWCDVLAGGIDDGG
jgi:hypothetical protein